MQHLIPILANVRGDIEDDIKGISIRAVLIATLVMVVLILIAIKVNKNGKHKELKKPLFIMITATMVLPTLLLMGSTIYINTISESKGPVHWHTDIEFWTCGQEIELRDPTGFLSNKIGTSTYHEHDDKRIHLEGVVIEKAYDASLEKFMAVTSGEITDTTLRIATNKGSYIENDIDGDVSTGDPTALDKFVSNDSEGYPVLTFNNGDECGTNGVTGEVQAFLYQFNKDNDTYQQIKLEDPKAYTMRDESVVPPGDCLIVEFDAPKDTTDKICEQFGVRDAERCTEFGVSEFNPDLCNIRLVESSEGGTQ